VPQTSLVAIHKRFYFSRKGAKTPRKKCLYAFLQQVLTLRSWRLCESCFFRLETSLTLENNSPEISVT